MYIDIGLTNHLDAETKLENKNSDTIVYYLLPHPKCIFYVNKRPSSFFFFSIMGLWVPNQLLSDMH